MVSVEETAPPAPVGESRGNNCSVMRFLPDLLRSGLMLFIKYQIMNEVGGREIWW